MALSEFDRGAQRAREMIRVHGVISARNHFNAAINHDEFDHGFESVLVSAEARAIAEASHNKQAEHYATAFQGSVVEAHPHVIALRQALELYEAAFEEWGTYDTAEPFFKAHEAAQEVLKNGKV